MREGREKIRRHRTEGWMRCLIAASRSPHHRLHLFLFPRFPELRNGAKRLSFWTKKPIITYIDERCISVVSGEVADRFIPVTESMCPPADLRSALSCLLFTPMRLPVASPSGAALVADRIGRLFLVFEETICLACRQSPALVSENALEETENTKDGNILAYASSFRWILS